MARFSDYRIHGELARGNMGVVFRAHDPQRGCDVALKRLLNAGSPIVAQRFRVEVAAARRLRHPHVVGVHAAGEDEAGLWLAMDLIEGESLHARLKRGPLPWLEVRRIGMQLADALAHAHGLGVLHRDLKPHNVLLDRAGDAYLADFGLARLVGDDMQLTREGDAVGTPVYMAPEQAHGDRERIGARTDVYGLGATLFHALTGAPPFWDRRIHVLLKRVIEEPPVAPSSHVPEVPPAMDALVLRCMAKAQEQRYPSAEAVAEALRQLLAEEPAPAPRWPLLVAGVVLTLALGVGGVTWALGDGEPPPREAQAALQEPPAPPKAAPTPEPEPEPPPLPLPEACERVRELVATFQGAEALELASELVEREPLAAEAQFVLAQCEADLGFAERAWERFRRACELDPELTRWLDPARSVWLRDYAALHPEPGGALTPRWRRAFGGQWQLEPDGVVRGEGGGLGTYQLSALFDDEATRDADYRLEVEVERDPLGEDQALRAYAGVILAARARDDFYTVFFVQNRSEAEGMLPAGAAGFREQFGVEPVFLRVTRQNGDGWEFPARGGALVPIQDGPWSRLVLEVDGSRLVANVDGERVLDLELERPLEGRVGLVKYYSHPFRYRGWSVTPR